jgi:ABC-type branched-subunit amino acid transport system ATPase component
VSLLEVLDVHRSFGGIRALDGSSMRLEEGTIGGLIGPNGAGKTTLMNVITGYERVEAGRIRLDGRDITNRLPDQVSGAGIGRTFQITRIFPHLSVLQNVHVAKRRSGLLEALRSWSSAGERSHALGLLQLVELDALADEPAEVLSHGQQKLLEFAMVLSLEPRVVLLDEPASGINPTLLAGLVARIRRMNRQGVTFLIVEHDMEFVMSLCELVTVMDRGRTIARGSPEQVRKDPIVLDAYLGTDAVYG